MGGAEPRAQAVAYRTPPHGMECDRGARVPSVAARPLRGVVEQLQGGRDALGEEPVGLVAVGQ